MSFRPPYCSCRNEPNSSLIAGTILLHGSEGEKFVELLSAEEGRGEAVDVGASGPEGMFMCFAAIKYARVARAKITIPIIDFSHLSILA